MAESSDEKSQVTPSMAHASPVNFSAGLPETVLPPVDPEILMELQVALDFDGDERRVRLGDVLRRDPTFILGWATLSQHARDEIEGYAYARVGYHRGLDALRRAGWKGSGNVRWREPNNRGFLLALECLRVRADAIGETIEAERCDLFLRQLDPDWHGLPEE
jgi:hypothetical protein